MDSCSPVSIQITSSTPRAVSQGVLGVGTAISPDYDDTLLFQQFGNFPNMAASIPACLALWTVIGGKETIHSLDA